MSHLSNQESKVCLDALFITLIGEDNFARWKETKAQVQMASEMHFVEWLLDIASATLPSRHPVEGQTTECKPRVSHAASSCSSSPIPHSNTEEEEEPEAAFSPSQEIILSNQEEIIVTSEPYYSEEYDTGTGAETDSYIKIEPTSPPDYTTAPKEMHEENSMDLKSDEAISESQESYQRAEEMLLDTPKLLKHDEVIGKDGKIMYRCFYCAQTFTFRNAISRHVKSIHLLNKAHTCRYCAKSFTRKDTLKNHEKTHCRYISPGRSEGSDENGSESFAIATSIS